MTPIFADCFCIQRRLHNKLWRRISLRAQLCCRRKLLSTLQNCFSFLFKELPFPVIREDKLPLQKKVRSTKNDASLSAKSYSGPFLLFHISAIVLFKSGFGNASINYESLVVCLCCPGDILGNNKNRFERGDMKGSDQEERSRKTETKYPIPCE